MTLPLGAFDVGSTISGTESIAANAGRLGLTWRLRPGTVVNGSNPTSMSVTLDGDIEPVNCISLIGPLTEGTRVMGEIVPPSGVYIVGYSGQQIANTSRLYSSLATPTTFSTTAYADLTDAVISDFVKAANYTKLRIDLRASGFAVTVGAGYAAQGAVNILGTDYPVNWFYFNVQNVHEAWSSKIDIDDMPAGTFDIQARFRVTVAAKTVTIDFNDYITLEVTEIV